VTSRAKGVTEREREKARVREREGEGRGGQVASRAKYDKVLRSQINVNVVLGSNEETRDDDTAGLSDMHAYYHLVCASMVIQRYLKQWKARKKARELAAAAEAPGGAASRTPLASPAATRAHSPATAVAASPEVSLARAPAAGTAVDHMPPSLAPCAQALPEVPGMKTSLDLENKTLLYVSFDVCRFVLTFVEYLRQCLPCPLSCSCSFPLSFFLSHAHLPNE